MFCPSDSFAFLLTYPPAQYCTILLTCTIPPTYFIIFVRACLYKLTNPTKIMLTNAPAMRDSPDSTGSAVVEMRNLRAEVNPEMYMGEPLSTYSERPIAPDP